MTKRLSFLTILSVFLLLTAGNAQAQYKGDLILRILGGPVTYGGDNDRNPEEGGAIDGTLKKYLEDMGLGIGAELGYGLTDRLSLNLRGHYGKYPQLESIFYNETEDNTRLMGALLLRWKLFGGDLGRKFTPYLNFGGNIFQASDKCWQNAIDWTGNSNCTNPENFGLGLSGGIGFLFGIKDNLGFNIDWTIHAPKPDVAVDGSNPTIVDGDEVNWDIFTQLSAGLHFTLKPGYVCNPVDILNIQVPVSAETGQTITFAGDTRLEASEPVAYFWDFGDGNTATGTSVTHTYRNAGNYTVTYSASNCGGTDAETKTINVTDPDPCSLAGAMPAISSANAPSSLEVGQSGSFSARATGNNVSYRWNFGDGSTSTSANPSHTYTRAGTYDVTLEVSNSCGVASGSPKTFRVMVTEDPCAKAALLTELNTVYFDYGSTTLDDTAKSLLNENISALKEVEGCNLRVAVYGYTDSVERSQRLSEQRAQAVFDYYVANGISQDMLSMSAMGQGTPPCSKEDPGRGCRRNRRVESIPMR